jgi:transcriptional regulator with XRE-family HTH domain
VSKRSATKSSRLSQKLKQIRVSLGLSQNEILDRLGLSESLFRSNISQYERGARVPSPKVLLQYSRLADIDLAVLIDDDMDLPARFSGQRKVSRRK